LLLHLTLSFCLPFLLLPLSLPHPPHAPSILLSSSYLILILPFLLPLPSSSSLPSVPPLIPLSLLYLTPLSPPSVISSVRSCSPPSLLPPLLVDVQRRLTSVLSINPVLSPRALLPLHHSVPFFHCNANAVSAGFF